MLKRIIYPSNALVEFVLMLRLQLSQPQQRHVLRLVEAVIVGEGRKTLAELYRLWVDAPDVSAASDFLRVSPWDEQHSEQQVQAFIITTCWLKREHAAKPWCCGSAWMTARTTKIRARLPWKGWIGSTTTRNGGSTSIARAWL